MKIAMATIMICLMVGCSSTRTVRVDAPGVSASVQESASTNWSVGDLALEAKTSKAADGSTTSTATAVATKNSMNSIITGSLAYAAGIISALAALGL